MEKKLLNTLHEQFAINQNHHKDLFIKFLIALFALFGTWGYVLVNTDINVTENIEVKGELIKYSYKVLLGTTFIVEAILSLLAFTIINIGYGFRRDHFLNYKIRLKYVDSYKQIFGELYNPTTKNFFNYLPGFHNSFFGFYTLANWSFHYCFSIKKQSAK